MLTHTSPDMSLLPGGWRPEESIEFDIRGEYRSPWTLRLAPNVFVIRDFISQASCDNIKEVMKRAPVMAPVSVMGLQDVTPETTGSFRATMWHEKLAQQFEERLKYCNFPRTIEADDYYPSDWWEGNKERRKWKYCGTSPLHRYMSYKSGGKGHAVHHDAAWISKDDDNYRSLYSTVLYLTNNTSAITRIINDNQSHLKVWDRDHEDWARPAREDEIVAESAPVKGSLLVFPHRLAHDVTPYTGDNGERVVIRGDIIFKAI